VTINRTCHFKHPGLKLGFPSLASLSVVKTCSTCWLLSFGARNGSSFSSYWTSGNLSNTRLSGAGMRKMLLCCCWVHEAAGGPPAFCVMEAGDGVSSLGIVVLAPGPLLYQRVALGGLCRAGGECLDAVRLMSLTLSLNLNPKSIPNSSLCTCTYTYICIEYAHVEIISTMS